MFSVIYTDDESMLLEVGKKFLELSGRLKVETALSAKEAVEIMKEKEIDCIVSDYMMPETDGIEFLRQLREEENNVPFILFTGRGREEIAIEALNAGADFYLQKGGDPVSQFKELEHKIIQAAERRKALNELRKSEEKYRILTEMTEDILYSLDTKGVITHVGPQVKRYGFEPGDFISKRIEDLIFEDDLGIVVEDLKKTLLSGEPTRTVFRIHDKSGGLVWMEDSGAPVFDENGEIVAISGILRDVTDRKIVEEELGESEKRYRELVELLPQTVFETDLEGNLGSVNKIGFETFGYLQEDLKEGINVFDLLVPGDRSRAKKNLGRMLAGEDLGGERYTAVRKDSTTFPVIIFSNLVKRNGRNEGVRGVIYNLDARDETCDIREDIALREQDFIVRNSPAIVFLWKAEEGWPVEYVSENISQMGYSTGDFLEGRVVFSSIIHPDDSERVAGEVAAYSAMEGREEFSQEYRIMTAGGDIRWVDDRTWIRRDESGAITHYQGIILDISEHKAAEKALAQSERRLADIISFLPDSTFVIDLEGRVIAWNRAMEEMTGVLAGDIIGRGDYEYAIAFYGERRPILIDLALKPDIGKEHRYYPMVRREGDAIFGETDYASPAGKPVVLWGKATPLYDEKEEVAGAIESIRDITDRKRAEEELKTLYSDLEVRVEERTADLRRAREAFSLANEKLNLLSSITRHDILNQLMGLKGFLDLMDSENAPDEIKMFIRGAAQAAANIEQQITFTKMYQDIGVKQPAWQNPGDFSGMQIAGLLPRGLKCTVDVGEFEIYADPLLPRVICNLVDNTVRHGEGATEIRFTSRFGDKEELVLVYEDNGSGIDETDKELIFKRGYGKNSGFGLFLAREILAITGITISEKGTPGRGVCFEITVPAGAYRQSGDGGDTGIWNSSST